MGVVGRSRVVGLAALSFLCACGDAGAPGGGADAGPPDAASPDAAPPDAGLPDAADLGPVQCQTAEECIQTTGSGCFQARPGGVCAGCGDEGDTCPAGTECIAGGTSGITECAFPCDTDGDCNVGMFCVPDGPIAGHCQPRRCGDGYPDCPYPYTFCRETTAPLFECARPLCEQGCPSPLYCPPEGGFCIEP
jgi:hypothetical protein